MKTKKYIDIQAVLSTPFIDIDSAEEKAEFKRVIFEKDSKGLYNILDSYLKNLTTAEHGRILPEGIRKFTGIGGIPNNPAQIAVYNAITDELQLDTEWMRFYDMINVTGTSAAEIVDIDAKKGTWRNYAPGDDIKLSDFGSTSYTQVKEKRFGYGVGILRRWIEGEQWWNVNRLMQSIMIKNQSKKANDAYTAIAALTTNTTTSAGTSLDQRLAALDAAYVALLTRIEGLGFEVSANTPAILLGRADFAGIMAQMLNRRQGSDTNNFVNVWNITSSVTFNSNLPTQVAAKDSLFLYVPGIKNKWITFDALRTEQTADFGTDSTKILAQEYWNSNENVDQVQIVNLQA